MPDNLRYIHGGWLVVKALHARQFTLHKQCLVSRMPYDFTNTDSWTSSWGVELIASNEDKLRRRERDRLRRQMETAREREVPTELEGARSDIVQLLLSILAQCAPASCTCAMHQYYKCCSLQLCMFLVILFSWSLLAKTLYTCGLYLFHDRSYAFYVYIIIQAYN